MRPYGGYYDELDQFDDVGYQGVAAMRRLMNDRQRDEHRLKERLFGGPRDDWDDGDWNDPDDFDDYDEDFDDYDEEEFDRYSMTR